MKVIFYQIYLIPLLLGALASIRAFRMQWPRPYRWFSIFLFVSLIVELFAVFWNNWLYKQFPVTYSASNHWIYNLFIFPEYLFYIFFFQQTCGYKLFTRKRAFLFMAAYTLWGLANILYVNGLYRYSAQTMVVSGITMVVLTSGYFISLLRSNKLVKLYREPLVWISIGAFIYHLCCIPYFTFFNYLNKVNLPLSLSLYQILTVLCCFMYSSYTIAFLCRKNFQR